MNRLLVALATLALVAAACGDDAEPSAQAETSSTAAPTTTTTEAPTTTTTTTAAPTTTTTTAAPETTTTAGGIVPGEDEEVDAVVLAFTTAFDSEVDYDGKARYIDDPSGLEETVAAYTATGDVVGRLTVEPASVAIEGDVATVTYTILFGGNPTYADQTGEAIRGAENWQVPRDVFCDLMSSARVGCP